MWLLISQHCVKRQITVLINISVMHSKHGASAITFI